MNIIEDMKSIGEQANSCCERIHLAITEKRYDDMVKEEAELEKLRQQMNTIVANCQMLCQECNRTKSNKT